MSASLPVPRRRHVVVVGGGIGGLVAAYRLGQSSNGVPIDVTVLEASGRAGGKLDTIELDGLPVEAGADSFVVRKPWAVELCKELGLGGELVVPGATGADVLVRGRVLPFPSRAAFGVPGDVEDLLRWPGLSLRGRVRAATDLWRRPRPAAGDESLRGLVSRRLGPEGSRALVEPLLAGLHAGDPDRLSIAATFPELQAWERDFGSLMRGAKAAVKAAGERPPKRGATEAPRGVLFATVWGGLARLVETLVAAIGESRVVLGARAGAIAAASDAPIAVASAGRTLACDAVVLATPAFESARLLERANAVAATELGRIAYSSSAVVTLVYPPGTASRLPDRTGVVVADQNVPITACTWLSRKWPLDAYGDRAVVRAFVGRAGREDLLRLGDDDLSGVVEKSVEEIAKLGATPERTKVTRWERAMPQYEVGHLERVDRIRAALARSPGVFVTGAAYGGVGIADCVRGANETAAAVRSYLHELGAPSGRDEHREVTQWTS